MAKKKVGGQPVTYSPNGNQQASQVPATPAPAQQPSQIPAAPVEKNNSQKLLTESDRSELYSRIQTYNINNLNNLKDEIKTYDNYLKLYLDDYKTNHPKVISALRSASTGLTDQVTLFNKLIQNKNNILKNINFNIPIDRSNEICDALTKIANSIQ